MTAKGLELAQAVFYGESPEFSQKVRTLWFSGTWIKGVRRCSRSIEEETAQEATQVEQQWVGWLLGKAGAAVKDIEASAGRIGCRTKQGVDPRWFEASTGAKIAVNQDGGWTEGEGMDVRGGPLQLTAAVAGGDSRPEGAEVFSESSHQLRVCMCRCSKGFGDSKYLEVLSCACV